SGLMLRSFLETINAPLGVDAKGVVVTEPVSLPQSERPDALLSTQRDLLRRLRALPGVRSASLALFYPIADLELESPAEIFGRTYQRGQAPLALSNEVSSQYFSTFGVRPLVGRTFNDGDTAGSAPVAIVSKRFAQEYLAGTNPLKARIRIQTGPTQHHWASIVGVVPDQRVNIVPDAFGVVGGIPEYYAPLAQLPLPFFSAIVRMPGLDPAAAGREIDSAFAAVLPLQPPPETSTISQRIANDTAKLRLTTILLGALAVIALVLALSGIFGVVSFSVTQRSREFGVRIALGATARSIVGDVLRRALLTTAIGVALGLVVTAFAARAIAPQLETVSPFDPATFTTVIVLVFLAALLASLQPALRATRIEPADSLRYE
ncbi:MAG TPA: FtsX-like permease family protein, partial [Candidatus Aquilonibacter sp.]